MIAGNRALHGAGVFVSEAVLELSDSTVSGNAARESGGGIASASSTLSMSNVTVSGNAAGTDGGGVITDGGGATLRNVTVFGNRADADGDGTGAGGGIRVHGPSPLLHNTLVASNLRGAETGTPDDVSGPLAAASSHNLVSDPGTAGDLTDGVKGNIVGVDWRTVLDPALKDNGGPTETHALLVGSIAVNSGSNAQALGPDGTPLVSDQRGPGFPRVVGPAVDVGAFEAPNSPPVAKPDRLSTGENTALAGDLFADNGEGPDADPDRDSLTIVRVDGSAAKVGSRFQLASGGWLTVNADGTFLFEPGGDFDFLPEWHSSDVAFTYEVGDGRGGTAVATAAIRVDGENDPPAAVADRVSVSARGVAGGNLLSNDVDKDWADIPSVAAVNGAWLPYDGTVSLPSGARLTVDSDGTFTYDPNGRFTALRPGQTATDSFTYEVSDGNGGSATATVTITITGVNDAPVAGPDAFRTTETGTVAGNLLANDSDPDRDPISVKTFGVLLDGQAVFLGGTTPAGRTLTLPSGAKLTVNADGAFRFTANHDWLAAGEFGRVTITYAAWDGAVAGYGRAVVDITGENDPPSTRIRNVYSDKYAEEGNLLDGVTDPDWGARLAVTTVNGSAAAVGTTVTLPSGVKLTVARGGAFRYDAYPVFRGLRSHQTATDAFTITVSDGQGGTTTVTVTVEVRGGGDEAGLIGFIDGEWYVGSATRDGFATKLWAKWADAGWDALARGDFNGGGAPDVLGLLDGAWYVGTVKGESFSTTLWGRWADADWRDVTAADLNLDGKVDILARVGGEWWASLSNGTSFKTPTRWAAWANVAWDRFFVTDVTGDRLPDLVGLVDGTWFVAAGSGVSFGGGTGAALWAKWADVAWSAVGIADLSGEGRADVYGLVGGEWFVGWNTGSGFWTARRAKWAAADWKDARVGDFDGDGVADLAARSGGQWYVGLSTATGLEASVARWAKWADVAWKDVVVGDYDGDGRDDIAGRHAGEWYVARSAGTRFETEFWARWAEGSWWNVQATAPPRPGTTGITVTTTDPITRPIPADTAVYTRPGGALSRAAAGGWWGQVAPIATVEPLALFWSRSEKDEELAAGLLGGR